MVLIELQKIRKYGSNASIKITGRWINVKVPEMLVCKNKTAVFTIIFGSWVVICMFYNNMFNLARLNMSDSRVLRGKPNKIPTLSRSLPFYNGSEEFLIDTQGCYIPNYMKTMVFVKPRYLHSTCGRRVVFVKKITDNIIQFIVDEVELKKYSKSKNVSCCFRFGKRSTEKDKEDFKITYSTCSFLQNGTTVKLEQEVISVICSDANNNSEIIYEDVYLILKKIVKKTINEKNKAWNVLILGMDTMSRARSYETLPHTLHYLYDNKWLDFRGHTKVGSNTYPNIMAMLAGMEASTAYSKCRKAGMSACNKYLIWSEYKKSDYITAYAEDYLQLPDTFSPYKGFKSPPTDHYTRPFFLTGETTNGNILCAKKLPSAKHVLNYAHDFGSSYKDENFFGIFWLNSYSHNLHNIPSLIDTDIVYFLESLMDEGLLNNTFIFFLSDHGIRFGKTRQSVESYYEERLPMLFLWTPLLFRTQYPTEYYNLQLNQNRLTTPYDIYETLWDILSKSNRSREIESSQACPQCTSLFDEKSPQRTCTDAMVDEKWCSCHDLTKSDKNDTAAQISLEVGVSYIYNRSRSLETQKCYECSEFQLKKVLRSHFYADVNNNRTYYVIAFVMSPGDVAYEVKVSTDGHDYKLINPTDTISSYNVRGNCVKNPNNRPYCVCKQSYSCNKKKVKLKKKLR